MKFSISTLMLAMVLAAVAFMTLKSRSAIVHEVVHFAVVAIGLTSLCVAINSAGNTRISFSVLATFIIGILALEAVPLSIGYWTTEILDPEFSSDDPFGPSCNPCFLDWFALLAGIVAYALVPPIVRWSNASR